MLLGISLSLMCGCCDVFWFKCGFCVAWKIGSVGVEKAGKRSWRFEDCWSDLFVDDEVRSLGGFCSLSVVVAVRRACVCVRIFGRSRIFDGGRLAKLYI